MKTTTKKTMSEMYNPLEVLSRLEKHQKSKAEELERYKAEAEERAAKFIKRLFGMKDYFITVGRILDFISSSNDTWQEFRKKKVLFTEDYYNEVGHMPAAILANDCGYREFKMHIGCFWVTLNQKRYYPDENTKQMTEHPSFEVHAKTYKKLPQCATEKLDRYSIHYTMSAKHKTIDEYEFYKGENRHLQRFVEELLTRDYYFKENPSIVHDYFNRLDKVLDEELPKVVQGICAFADKNIEKIKTSA